MNMTPMIDIVFLLLIFFMTVSQVSEINKVQLDLPKLTGSADQKPSTITLNVDQQGQLILSGRNVGLGELIAAVSDELRRVGDDPSPAFESFTLARQVAFRYAMTVFSSSRVKEVRMASPTPAGRMRQEDTSCYIEIAARLLYFTGLTSSMRRRKQAG